MALLKKKPTADKQQVRINLLTSVLDEAKAYQKWSELPRLDDVIEQALELVFSKDRDWKKFKAMRND